MARFWLERELSISTLKKRSVETTSKVQVRFPIHAQFLNSWKNYQEMLRQIIDWFEEINVDY